MHRRSSTLSSWQCSECNALNSWLTPGFCPACGSRDPFGGGRNSYGGWGNSSNLQNEWRSGDNSYGGEGSSIDSYGGAIDSDADSDSASTWSEANSTTTATSFSLETDDTLSKELVDFMWVDPSLRDVLRDWHDRGAIDGDRLERKTRRLLKRVASELLRVAQNLEERRAAKFMALNTRTISSLIRSKPAEGDAKVALSTLLSRTSKPGQSGKQDAFNVDWSSSEDETDGEEDQPVAEDEQNDLARAKRFITGSEAFARFCRKLGNFVRPTLRSMLLEYIERNDRGAGTLCTPWEIESAKTLANEFRDIDPGSVRSWDKRSRNHLELFQYRAERLTGQRWNWWPLHSIYTSSGVKGLYLQWSCVCGESREILVPEPLAIAIEQLAKYLALAVGGAKDSVSLTSQHHIPLQEQPPSVSKVPSGRQQRQQASLAQGSGQTVAVCSDDVTTTSQDEDRWVLLVVQSRRDYHLAQIEVSSLDSYAFFAKLRSAYYGLRGPVACYLSVWQYSHCDFYKFEKFDEHAFAPRRCHAIPDPQDPEYEYQPKPIEDIPPITAHEFYKRFYSSAPSIFPLRCHRACSCVKIKQKAHNREVINLLPKRRLQVDICSEQREFFWGLYAQEEIQFFRVLIYNVVCISPLVWFFFMWMFRWAHGGDMQNASVPLMTMLTFLTLFWSTFISCLKKNEHGTST